MVKTPGSPVRQGVGRLSVIENLQSQILELKQTCETQQQALKKLHLRLDKSDEKLFEQRVINQRQLQELDELRQQLKN